MKRVEIFVNTVKVLINILNGALKIFLLFTSELGCSKSVKRVIFGVLSIK